MKPYQELTRRGRLRRLRKLAEIALQHYSLEDCRLTFQHYQGNVVFRVDVPGGEEAETSIFVPNRYNLRILTTHNEEMIRSELVWLAALRREADLPVREPVPNLDGELYTFIELPGIPHGRYVTLMRWVDGRRLEGGLRPKHMQSWGEITAKLHNFSAGWQPPDGFFRPAWDWRGQLGGRDFRVSVEELVERMPQEFRQPFLEISEEVQKVTRRLGKKSDAYGLIHADMYPENLLFKAGRAIPIDFEDCGWGYWIWDIGTGLSTWPWTEDFAWRRDAFLEGYARYRTLPEAQLKHLDLFMAATYATMALWATMFIYHDPAMEAEHAAWRAGEGEKLLRFFENAK
jgi:Ser/Thr protein kinase RdoA (MazF antagonist)